MKGWWLTLRDVKNANCESGDSVSKEAFLEAVSGQPVENGNSVTEVLKAGPPRTPAAPGQLGPKPHARTRLVLLGAVGLFEAVLGEDAPVHGHGGAHVVPKVPNWVGGGSTRWPLKSRLISADTRGLFHDFYSKVCPCCLDDFLPARLFLFFLFHPWLIPQVETGDTKKKERKVSRCRLSSGCWAVKSSGSYCPKSDLTFKSRSRHDANSYY